ncbi:MAG: TetR family transcriptional regulator [bacterium]|nr:TetR family transcriptional regulator [bacterium]
MMPALPDRAATSRSRTPAPPRASRSERRESTRRRLLDAALEAIAERGYSGATTAEIARRAGVSEGMIFKVAASKSELLAESVHDLFERLIVEYKAEFESLGSRGDRVEAAIELLHSAYRRPELRAAFELYFATRSDETLARELQKVALRHRMGIRTLAKRLFVAAAEDEDRLAAAVDLAMNTLQGEALSSVANPDPERSQRVVKLLAELLRPLLAPTEATRRTEVKENR